MSLAWAVFLPLAATGCQHTSATGGGDAASAPASANASAPAGDPSKAGQPATDAASTGGALGDAADTGRAVVAVAPFTGPDGEVGWLGWLLADHITRRLLMAGHAEPDSETAAHPVDVFSWRQTISAARAAGIPPGEVAQAAPALLRELGADRVLVGRYTLDGARAVIEWRLAGATDAERQEVTTGVDQVSAAAYGVGASALRLLGHPTERANAPAALPRAAVRNWGEALGILARQSQDARASVVLKKPERIKAMVALKAVNRDAPTFGPAWAARAIVAALDGDWDDAEAALAKAEALTAGGAPTAAIARYYVSEQTAQQDAARAALVAAVDEYPGALQVLGYLGDAYYAGGEYEKALAIFERYLARVPASPYAAYRRDAVLARLGQKDEALQNAKALYARHPDSVVILAALASRQIDAGKLAEARQTLERGLEASPGHPLLLTRLSFVELEGGDAKKALVLARKAVAKIGDGRGMSTAGYAHIDLARALAVQGRREEAKASLLKAVRLGVDAGDLDRLAADPRLEGFIEFPIVVRPLDDE